MIHIKLPIEEQKRLVYYLAMEEYVARNIHTLVKPGSNGAREAFFMWQVPPTVIFGRNQIMESEVNLDYCKEHKVNLFRRKSGGGCVYADMGNIMLSYISDSTDVAFTFDRYLQHLALYLSRLGLNAERSGRNDVLVDGKKVSGNAFFLLPKASIVHGTLLFNSDFEALEKAITPSAAKIHSKGVASVRQHVTNIYEELDKVSGGNALKYKDINIFKKYILDSFCDHDEQGNISEVTLSSKDMEMIDSIEATYLDPEFMSGKKHSYAIEYGGKIDNVGEIKVFINLEADLVDNCHLEGDFFHIKGDIDNLLTDKLKGHSNDKDSFIKALENVKLEEYIMNLKTQDFIEFIFSHKIK